MDPHHPSTTCAAPTTALFGRGRVSAQRAAIASTVESMRGAFTAEDLHRAVTGPEPGIGLATVYRAIAVMQAAGTLVAVGERGGSTLLALCVRHDHHHHLVCTGCGAVIGVDCPIGDAAARAAADGGHLVTGHEINLTGLCAGCRARSGDA